MTMSDGLKDARPLTIDQMTSDQIELLEGLQKELSALYKRVSQQKPEAESGPWVRINSNREGRVFFLDGERGTGKTSLLLTALRGWRMADDKRPNWPSLGGDTAEKLFKDMKFAKVLPILDFDPIPPKLPLMAWVIQGLRSLVESLPKAKIKDKLLREHWSELVQAAYEGWAVPSVAASRTESYLDQERRLNRWQKMPEFWNNFMNNLLEKAEEDGILNRDDVLILPIDDVDMQVEHAADLLYVLRFLQHPRLVYLCNGNLEHLREVLRLRYLRSHINVGTEQGVNDANRIQSKVMADALIEKTIVWYKALKLIDLNTALMMQSGKLRQLLDQHKIQDQSLGDLIASVNSDGPILRMRAWQRLVEDLQRNEKPIDALESFLIAIADSFFVKPYLEQNGETLSFTQELKLIYRGVPKYTWSNGIFAGGDFSILMETQVFDHFSENTQNITSLFDESYSQFYTTRFNDARPVVKTIFNPIDNYTNFISILKDIIKAPKVSEDFDPLMVWRTHSNTTVYWPWADVPISINKKRILWNKSLNKAGGNDISVGRLAYEWILAQICWSFPNEDFSEYTLQKSITPQSPDWSRLLSCIKRLAMMPNSPIANWYNNVLPTLAAPEYGLFEQDASIILDHFLIKSTTDYDSDDIYNMYNSLFSNWNSQRQIVYNGPGPLHKNGYSDITIIEKTPSTSVWKQKHQHPADWFGFLSNNVKEIIIKNFITYWSNPNGSIRGPMAVWTGRLISGSKIDWKSDLSNLLTNPRITKTNDTTLYYLWKTWVKLAEEQGSVGEDAIKWFALDTDNYLQWNGPNIIASINTQPVQHLENMKVWSPGSWDFAIPGVADTPIPLQAIGGWTGLIQSIIVDRTQSKQYGQIQPVDWFQLQTPTVLLEINGVAWPVPEGQNWSKWMYLLFRWHAIIERIPEYQKLYYEPFELQKWIAVNYILICRTFQLNANRNSWNLVPIAPSLITSDVLSNHGLPDSPTEWFVEIVKNFKGLIKGSISPKWEEFIK